MGADFCCLICMAKKGKMSKTSYKSIKLVKFCYWKFMEYVVCLYKTKRRTQN